jgi:hypothetical protein
MAEAMTGRTVLVDVSRRPELAREYGVAVVPTIVAAQPDGTVVDRWLANVQRLDRAREREAGLDSAFDRKHAVAKGDPPESVPRREHVG